MRITVNQVTLRNFKGVREFHFEPGNRSACVYGDNETGKTTLSDALHWLLFDKDSAGRSDFDVKTIDRSTGEPMHNLEHSVEAELVRSEDGHDSTLRLTKVYHEVWTRKRGSASETFTGHTTDHFVDGVPKSAGEYKDVVGGFLGVDEATFGLLTNPAAFNGLHWERRRALLFELAGSVEDSDVAASAEGLERVAGIVGSRSFEDAKAVAKADRKRIGDELDTIPTRIDEAQRAVPSLPPVPAVTRAALEKRESELLAERQSVESGGEVTALRKRLAELQAETQEVVNAENAAQTLSAAKAREASRAKRDEVERLRDDLARLSDTRRTANSAITASENAAKTAQAQAVGYLDEWKRSDAETVDLSAVEDVCPACERPLPVAKVAEARAKAEATFNLRKSERLTTLRADGKRLKEEADRHAKNAANTKRGLQATESRMAEVSERIDALQSELAVQAERPSQGDSPRVAALREEAARVEAAVETAGQDSAPALAAIDAKLDALREEKAAVSAYEEAERARQRADERVAELEARQKALAAEYERVEADLYALEQFTRAKCRLIEERVNGRFSLVTFRLFEEQVNGGLKEVCETLVDGVPYSTALNNAACIAAGLDVVKTLSEHYGVFAPCFLDNAEAITEIPPMPCQVISLFVSKNDKTLRVERTAS